MQYKAKKINHYPPSAVGIKNSQSGVALIIVLLILILIMVIGAVAIRGSMTDLRVSTAAQVNKLLFQANDAAYMKVEREDRILNERRGSAETLKGYMSSPQRLGHEVSFCVRPRTERLFNVINGISERNTEGDLLTKYGDNGFCDPDNTAHYVNEGRVITQMTFVRPQGLSEERILDREIEGTSTADLKKPDNAGTSPIECTEFIGYVTSVIPSLSSASLDDIGSCLKKPRTGTDTVDTCLLALDVPYQTQQQIYVNQPEGFNCVSGN